MAKRFLTVAAMVAIALAFAPCMHADIATELILSDGTDTVTIDVSSTNVVTVTCNAGSCGDITQANVGSKITVDYAHGTISVSHAAFGSQFTISATAQGGVDSLPLPTLQNLNQLDATSTGSGTLTSTFTDTQYPNLSPILNVADSNTTDAGISSSTIDFYTYTDGTDGVPAEAAGNPVSHNQLTNHSDNNSLDGVDYTNPNPTPPNSSLESKTVMAFTGAGHIQANITISNVVVPEPASIIFLGTLVFGLTAVIRKRHAKRQL